MTDHLEHRKRRAADRQIERNRELEAKSLYYAAAGERTARFMVALIEAAVQLLLDLPPEATASDRAHESWHDLIDELIEAQHELEPWRGRVRLDPVDQIVAMLTEGGDDGGSDDHDDQPRDQPPGTPVPAAFRRAMAT